MVQVINPPVTYGQLLGESLGKGLNQGISAALNQHLEQKRARSALEGLKPLALQAGVGEKEWENVSRSGLPPDTVLKGIKLLNEQKQLQSYNKQLGAMEDFGQGSFVQNQLGSESAPSENALQPQMQPQDQVAGSQEQPQATAQIRYKTSPILASRQIPPPASAAQIPQHSQARFQAQQLGYNHNKEL